MNDKIQTISTKYKWPLAIGFIKSKLSEFPEGLQKHEFLEFKTTHPDPKKMSSWPIGNQYNLKVGKRLNREFLKTCLIALTDWGDVVKIGEGNSTKYKLASFGKEMTKEEYNKIYNFLESV